MEGFSLRKRSFSSGIGVVLEAMSSSAYFEDV
jgi:hypothetical protein